MNRFKKEIRKKGIKLENEYDSIPYVFDNGISIQAIDINSETATIVHFYNVDVVIERMERDGSMTDISNMGIPW